LLATAGGFERCVRIWDLRTGRLCRKIKGHAFGTNGLSFSPDGATLATAGNDGAIRLWELATGDPCTVLDGHASSVGGVAFSPDGRLLVATARNDNHLRVWNLEELGEDSAQSARTGLAPEPPIPSHHAAAR
jgi:WD40 repeat protein